MNIINDRYIGATGREALVDLEIPNHFNENIVVFIHGYMGFKDWGPWNLMQNYFVERGFGFCKFNMTHNGTTPDNPTDFIDLAAFGNNCYSHEKKDISFLLDWLEKRIDLSECSLHLLGHSRGGGIALLTSSDSRVSSIVTLAAISSIEKRFEFDQKILEEWEKLGVRFVKNSRTNQDLPHNFYQYLDFLENKDNLSIQKACEDLKKPLLIIHGNKDESVSISEGYDIARWSKNQLHVIPEATHTFGGTHPYESQLLPVNLEECCGLISEFIVNQNL